MTIVQLSWCTECFFLLKGSFFLPIVTIWSNGLTDVVNWRYIIETDWTCITWDTSDTSCSNYVASKTNVFRLFIVNKKNSSPTGFKISEKAQTAHYSTVKLPYFISLSAIHAYWGRGWGWAVVSTILITLELFYSTKRIQRVAVSPHRTTKVINRAINKNEDKYRREKITRNDRDKIKKTEK